MISDHSYTAVTELFCIKDKQPLLGLFIYFLLLNLLMKEIQEMIKCNLNVLQIGNIKQSSCFSSIAQEDLTGQQHLEIQSSKIFFSKTKSVTLISKNTFLRYIHVHYEDTFPSNSKCIDLNYMNI